MTCIRHEIRHGCMGHSNLIPFTVRRLVRPASLANILVKIEDIHIQPPNISDDEQQAQREPREPCLAVKEEVGFRNRKTTTTDSIPSRTAGYVTLLKSVGLQASADTVRVSMNLSLHS